MIHFLNLFASLVTTTKMRIKWPHFFVLVVLLFVVHWSSHQALILLQCWNRNFLLLFLGTAKYNLSQVKWASQVALQWLPDTDVFPTFHTAAHHPAAVPAAQEATGGEFKDLGTFLVFWMFQIPVAWSIRPWDGLLWGPGIWQKDRLMSGHGWLAAKWGKLLTACWMMRQKGSLAAKRVA